MSDKKMKVSIIGLGFGAEFLPIYQAHANAEIHSICQRTESKLNEIGDQFNIERRIYIQFIDGIIPEVMRRVTPTTCKGKGCTKVCDARHTGICNKLVPSTVRLHHGFNMAMAACSFSSAIALRALSLKASGFMNSICLPSIRLDTGFADRRHIVRHTGQNLCHVAHLHHRSLAL